MTTVKKYQILLFDVDDTLLDFQAAEDAALRRLFKNQNFPLTAEIKAHYRLINRRLWRAYEQGRIDRDRAVNTRFSVLLSAYGREVDGVLLEKKYRSYLEKEHQLIDGALELIKDLQRHFDLYIVTNGVSNTQFRRLRDSGLYPLFQAIFISEDIGFQKPMREYFNYVFAHIPRFAPEQALLIGDSLSSDIQGGQRAGLDTCWFNPGHQPNETDAVPTYQITKLHELQQILNGQKNGCRS